MADARRPSGFDQFALGPDYRRAYVVAAAPQHPGAIQLVEFWHEREKAGGIVVGRDIPSRPIAGILRHLTIYEPLAGYGDFRVRHAGTAYIEHYGYDVTGKLMSELFDVESFSHNRAKAEQVIRSETPEILDANLRQFGISRRHYEVVQLPIWGAGMQSRWLLCGIFRLE